MVYNEVIAEIQCYLISANGWYIYVYIYIYIYKQLKEMFLIIMLSDLFLLNSSWFDGLQ